MLRTLTTIGLLVAIALPLWDMAMFRPGRRTLAAPRVAWIERLIYAVFLIAVLLMALSSFGMILVGQTMHGWMLILHMSVAGMFFLYFGLKLAQSSSRASASHLLHASVIYLPVVLTVMMVAKR